ncbi:unnamed protein product, partial [Closterium sp. NIES-53]
MLPHGHPIAHLPLSPPSTPPPSSLPFPSLPFPSPPAPCSPPPTARQPCFPALRGLDEELASDSILACIASIESDTHEEPDPSLAASLMSLFKPKTKKPLPQGAITSVVDGLRGLYESKLRPLEEAYRFHDFHSPAL